LTKHTGRDHGFTLTRLVSHHYCECGRERAALVKEFAPDLTGHLVRCAACGGTAHHSGNHTVCLRCGRYEETGSVTGDTLEITQPDGTQPAGAR